MAASHDRKIELVSGNCHVENQKSAVAGVIAVICCNFHHAVNDRCLSNTPLPLVVRVLLFCWNLETIVLFDFMVDTKI